MAKEKQTGSLVALKRMNIAAEEEGVPATTIREICLLKELHHDNVVRLFDVMFQSPKLTLVFEYCEYDLKKYIDAKPLKKLDIETEVKPFMRQLLAGLAYIHQKSVVHRDMKPQNLLLTANRELKIADFGLARVEGIPVKKYTHEAVTLWYRSPDVILGSANYGLAVDMWAVGCIFSEMITGNPLFNGHTDQEQLQKITRMFGPPTKENWPSLHVYPNSKTLMGPETIRNEPAALSDFIRTTELSNLGPDGVDLLKRLMLYEPSKRISAADALEHPFLHTVNDGGAEARSLLSMTNQLTAALSQLSLDSAAGNTIHPADRTNSDAHLGGDFGGSGSIRTPQPPSNPRPQHDGR